jgi:hypothetical protein
MKPSPTLLLAVGVLLLIGLAICAIPSLLTSSG